MTLVNDVNNLNYVTVIMNTFQENPYFLSKAINSYIIQKDVKVQLIISTVVGDPSIQFIKRCKPNIIDLCISTKKNILVKVLKEFFINSIRQLN